MLATCLGLMKRDVPDVPAFFLTSLGKLHAHGVPLQLEPLFPRVPWPVPRGTPNVAHLVSWDHSESWSVATYNDFPTSTQVSEEVEVFDLEAGENDSYLARHQVDGRVLFPATGYMVLAWKSLAKRSGKPYTQVPVIFEDVTLHRAIILPKSAGSEALEALTDALAAQSIEGGFVLLSLRTALTPAEMFLSTVGKVPLRVHSRDIVEAAFGKRGFRLVSLRSNNVSALLLFRKGPATPAGAEKQVVIRVRSGGFGWVEEIKAKATEYQERPSGENIWLVAEDVGSSGVVGLTNCLRLETGGHHIRWAVYLAEANGSGCGKTSERGFS
ncbi:fatty acid synthase, putative [Ixodes scapularis]|uniref:Fatty acid synthase, putative n=1 Tax=Ixodes scapularis TaxID=6945 RepID=B7Q6F3_IXOSC|nr:fatty acid synthase, putative [Ixodes scapularis]|eukprot:XP_002411956.1 fatty acid synthase, putative [Ixodes scapularis]